MSALLLTAGLSGQAGQALSTKNGEWPHYTADLPGTKYSPLDQGEYLAFSLPQSDTPDTSGTR